MRCSKANQIGAALGWALSAPTRSIFAAARAASGQAAIAPPSSVTNSKTDRLPSGGQWLHEIKHDGFRIIARKNAMGRHTWHITSIPWIDRLIGTGPAIKG